MPMTLTPDQVRFELHDGMPVIRLLVARPAEAAAAGWSLMSRVTLCVVDGPGDAGYLFPRFGLEAPDGWEEAAEQHEGAYVVFGDAGEANVFAQNV